jgi:hypothetical protein
MVLPLYLAMTGAEFAVCSSFPQNVAWMACHFSSYGTGLSNLPPPLPEGAMVILNDRTPIHGHDPDTILQQLMALRPSCLLLDFQRPGVDTVMELARILAKELPCPVGVSHIYGKELNCPVFLPPVPPDVALEEYLEPWLGREIWLEAALEGITYTLTENGSTASPLLHPPQDGLAEDSLHCHYKIEATDNTAQIHLYRTPEDLENLLRNAKNHGITKAVGLYQELKNLEL